MIENSSSGQTLRGPGFGCWLALAVTIGLFGTWFWANVRETNRQRNEMEAGGILKRIAVSEAEYKANDKDGNGVQDFWTADVTGLFRAGLIDRAVAEADAAPVLPLVPKPVPYRGYFFRALVADDHYSPAKPYRQDTDAKSGKVHNLDRFGFVAFPAELGVTGRCMWIVNENNSAPRHDLSIPVPSNWPADQSLNEWSKVQ